MAKFDIVESVGHAYRFLWSERRYLMRIALVPILVKLACDLTVELFNYDTVFIRQALVMLPSYFMDGWLLSHVVRFALFGQRWPFRAGGHNGGNNDVQLMQDRAQGLLTGTATYAATRFLSMGALTLVSKLVTPLAPAAGHAGAASDLKSGALLASILLIFGGVWAFRVLWLFIAAAANVSMMGFLKRISGFATSFYMIGAWLIAFMPLLLASTLVTSVLILPFAAPGAMSASPVAAAITLIVGVFADTLIEIVTTFAMAAGVRPFLAEVAQAERTVSHDRQP